MIMSYWTHLYRKHFANNELHFFTISNLNYTVFVSLAHIYIFISRKETEDLERRTFRGLFAVRSVVCDSVEGNGRSFSVVDG